MWLTSLPKISGSLPEQIQDYFSPEVVLELFSPDRVFTVRTKKSQDYFRTKVVLGSLPKILGRLPKLLGRLPELSCRLPDLSCPGQGGELF